MIVLRWKENGEELTVFLNGEIDHYAAESLRNQIEALIRKKNVKTLIFDFAGVTFMDSSGIGMLIGRYKTMASRGGWVYACGLTGPTERVFKMAGLHRIIAQLERSKEA